MPTLGVPHEIFMCRVGDRSLQRCLLAYEHGNLHIAKTRPLSGVETAARPREVGENPELSATSLLIIMKKAGSPTAQGLPPHYIIPLQTVSSPSYSFLLLPYGTSGAACCLLRRLRTCLLALDFLVTHTYLVHHNLT